MITLIAAMSKERAIGKNGDIPWKSRADLGLFKRETIGSLVIMGRKTWESLPRRPLPGRDNLVITSRPLDVIASHSDVLTATTVDGALQQARDNQYDRISVIGGQSIYAAFMAFADRMVLTEVDISIDDADTFYPTFDENQWTKSELGKHESLNQEDPGFTVYEYLKRPS